MQMQMNWKTVLHQSGCAGLADHLVLKQVMVAEKENALQLYFSAGQPVSEEDTESLRKAFAQILPEVDIRLDIAQQEAEALEEETPTPESPQREAAPGEQIKAEPTPRGETKTAAVQAAPTALEKRQAEAALPTRRERPQVVRNGPKSVFGEPRKRIKTYAISDLQEQTGNCAIEGRVYKAEIRPLWDNRNSFLIFYVTDETNSISCKLRFANDSPSGRRLKDSVQVGATLRVEGETYLDKYMGGELALEVKCIQLAPPLPMRMDDAEEKRVELHLHSMMSTMDSMVNIKEAVQTAARWGHKAIAVTDHGVVQAYPEFYSAAVKAGIKGIFGMEGYLYDDCRMMALPEDQTFVVFDLETTGFKENSDQIIEIGAVKLQNGQVIDRFSCFLNPGMRLPAKIIELTSITDAMLADAPFAQEALADFAQFCEGTMLVGHNATGFDMRFLLTHAQRYDIVFPDLHMDTLTLARALLRDLENHKLDTLVAHFGIELAHHHRAVDDAEATALLFLRLCELWKASGVADWPIANQEIVMRSGRSKGQNYHFILLVKNAEGLRHLYELVTESHLRYFRGRPRIPRSLLVQLREGLILGSACASGELFQRLLDKADESVLERTASFYDYIEVQPIGNNGYLLRGGAVADEAGLRALNVQLVALADKLGKPCVATGDVHYLHPNDEIYRQIILTSQEYDDAREHIPLHFHTTDEMLAEFAYLGEEKAREVVIETPQQIAEQCEMLRPFPEETCQPELEGAEEWLVQTCYGKAHEIYGDPLPEIVEKRLEHELGAITKYKFSSLYVTACRLVQKSNEDGYLVGSRGSVGSSLVAYLGGITEVNALAPHYVCPQCKHSDFEAGEHGESGCGVDLPEANCPVCGTPYRKDGYNIPFETFLGFEGDKVPDIDLNFSGDYQPVAHKYTEVLFGKGNVYRAGTISGVQERTAYGYTLKYVETTGKDVSRAEKERLAAGCCGVKRTTGQHPGGIVVVPADRSVYEFTPLQRPADKISAGSVTTHFDFSSMHDTLVKLDILGHDDPTMIHQLQKWTGLNPQEIPLDDPDTMKLFSGVEILGVDAKDLMSEVGTYGVPEFGTSFVRNMLVETRPTTMEELVRISGLSHGTDVWTGNAQELIRGNVVSLREAICTRDDIMTYLIAKGMDKKEAFNIMERVRKGKGLTEEMRAHMTAAKVEDWYIESCEKISYMFPRAHAAAYVMMAYRIAYCKVHHPAAYYASYFSVRGDGFEIGEASAGPAQLRNRINEIYKMDKQDRSSKEGLAKALELVLEMKLRGLDFAPIDLMQSEASNFQVLDEKTLRPPLDVIGGFGSKAAESIVEARANGSFRTREDLLKRTSIGNSGLELLAAQGCLAELPETDQTLLF